MALDVTEIAPSLAVAKDRCPVSQSVDDSPALRTALGRYPNEVSVASYTGKRC